MFTILATFPTGINKTRQYAFKYPIEIPSDSIVVVDTQHGLAVAKVYASVKPKLHHVKPIKWVYGVIDHTIYDEMIDREEQMKRLTVSIGGGSG